MTDKINPSHYLCGDVETIDHIQVILTNEEFKGYLKGTIIKYLARAGRKDGEGSADDYAKAAWFKKRLETLYALDGLDW